VIQNDANEQNVLIDDTRSRVTGIIDFGDCLHTCLIFGAPDPPTHPSTRPPARPPHTHPHTPEHTARARSPLSATRALCVCLSGAHTILVSAPRTRNCTLTLISTLNPRPRPAPSNPPELAICIAYLMLGKKGAPALPCVLPCRRACHSVLGFPPPHLTDPPPPPSRLPPPLLLLATATSSSCAMRCVAPLCAPARAAWARQTR